MLLHILEPYMIPILLLIMWGVVITALVLIRNIYSKERAFEQKQEEIYIDYNTVLTTAHHKAEEIIERASEEAVEIKHDHEKMDKKVAKDVEEAFQKVLKDNQQTLTYSSEEYIKEFKAELAELKNASLKSVDDTLKEIHKTSTDEFTELKSLIQQQIATNQDSLSNKLQGEYEKAHQEISQYREQKFADVDKKIDILIGKIAQEVLGKAIPVSDHHQLVIDALEKAQKEGIFS